MEYSRHVIGIKDQLDIHQVLRAISALHDQVAVNIAESAEAKPVLFSEENLRTILAGAPESLFVEALPLGAYRNMVMQKIEQVVQSTVALRTELRTHYVAELAAQVRDFLSQLGAALPLLQCWALQNARSVVAEEVRKLQNLSGQLAASSFEHGDNVRCMDDLQHQILPALNKLLRAFRK